ncbi:WDGH domain-containing protein [Glycomyces tarimensis]
MSADKPMTDAKLDEARAFANGEVPASPEAVAKGRMIAKRLLAEVDRLRAETRELTEAFAAITAESAELQLERIQLDRSSHCGSCRQHESVDRYRARWQAVATTSRRYKRERDALTAKLAETEQGRDRAVRLANDNAQAYEEVKTELGRAKAARDGLRAELDSINGTVIQTGTAHGLNGLAAVRQLGTRYQEEKDKAERLSKACDAARAELAETKAEGSRLYRSLQETARLVEADRDALAAAVAAGEASDGHHTHRELYDYRMLYNAHAAHGWLRAGIPVCKSWRHADGEPCFGGGWFVVVAELPTGQVSNHYRTEHWDLFNVPEALPPDWDGHTPAEAADRLRAALDRVTACTGCGKCSSCRGRAEQRWNATTMPPPAQEAHDER